MLLLTTVLTRREIPYLRQHTEPTSFGLTGTVVELMRSLRNRQFALVFLVVLISSAIGGVTTNIGIYMTTFFWGLTTEDLRWFAFAAVGAIFAFPLVAAIQRKWDKKNILLVCSTVSLLDGILLINLRFIDVLPQNGETMLLVILVGMAVFGSVVAVIQGIIGASIIADTLDDHELRTGYRQEAMFNAALSFSGKAVSGIGIIMGGVVLTAIDFPVGLTPAEVPADTILRLGIVVGVAIPLLHLIPISLITRYRITRAEHARIKSELDVRRNSVL